MKRKLFITSILCTIAALSLQASIAFALPDSQTRLFRLEIYYFDHDIIDADSGGTAPAPGEGTGPLAGCDNAEMIWNYLLGATVQGRALEAHHVAGILGNIQAESGFEPARNQGTPPGTITTTPGSAGYGLVQWTPGTKIMPAFNRLRNTFDPPAEHPGHMEFQLTLLLEQLNGQSEIQEGAAGRHLMSQTTVDGAARSFMVRYERPADQSESAQRTRSGFAQDQHTRFTTGGGCG